MLGLIRLVIIGFLFLTPIYILLSIWSRRTRAARLKREWEDTGRPGTLEAHVENGLADYDKSLRRKLILLVYVLPVVVIGTIVYMTNYR